jgi:hypothetical protein
MRDAGDYFVAARPAAPVGLSDNEAPPAAVPPRRVPPRIVVLAAGVAVLVLLAAVVVVVRRSSHGPVDTRPIVVPASIGGFPLSVDAVATQHQQQMVPILRKIFGKNASASAKYGGGYMNLLVGRGPVDRPRWGDVAQTAPERISFGDITCAQFQGLTMVFVCWYSTPTFGASLLVLKGKGMPAMPEAAAALEAVIPEMRGAAR